jgi:ppGpp synthetase/RelA/SpoT-type nucleotidyltranferase
MTFDEYETFGHLLYGAFARHIRDVLEAAFGARSEGPHPQSIQQRRKSPASLQSKLEHRHIAANTAIEEQIKDLAGVRLILYTNTDVDRFLQSRLIPQLFKVHWAETRIHYPTAENDAQRYKAFHYTVSLADEIAQGNELAKFAGLRCEIQIQTILDHAWAETYHDMVYKARLSEGFGTRQLADIDARMKRVMDKYLRAAGYELQKVQHDHERLMQGKALFDRGSLEALDAAKDNNERGDLLDALAEHVLPHYDDVAAFYADVCAALDRCIRAARTTATVPVKTSLGNIRGTESTEVTRKAIEILDRLRYVDVIRTLNTLLDLYQQETQADLRKQIVDVIRQLSENDMAAWQQVGPGVQYAVSEQLNGIADEKLDILRVPLVTAWGALLSAEIEGLTSTSSTMTISKGSVPVNDAVKLLRERAIAGLTRLLDRAGNETQQREAIAALRNATMLPSSESYSNALCQLVCENTVAVTRILHARLPQFSYELAQHLEDQALYDYHRAGEFIEAEQFYCDAAAEAVRAEIRQMRDTLNADAVFVRYKTLVGFEVVMPPQWEDPDFDFEAVERFRRARIAGYLAAISEETWPDWKPVILRCAATQSNDGATFPLFTDFLTELSQQKPRLVLSLIAQRDPHLRNFLAAALAGLARSSEQAAYQTLLRDGLDAGEDLTALMQHMCSLDAPDIAFVEAILQKAIARDDRVAISCCVSFAIERHSVEQPLVDRLFDPAVDHFVAKKDPRWAHAAWFLRQARGFLSALNAPTAAKLLQSFVPLSRLTHTQERLIALLAEHHPGLVWDYFKARLDYAAPDDSERYEPIPYTLHDLSKALSKDPGLAVAAVRTWYAPENRRFRFTGGRLLHAVFSTFTEALGNSLIALIVAGGRDDIAFATLILENYRGEAVTHPLIKHIIAQLPEDDPLLSGIYVCLGNTGVVGGEYGLVEARRNKKHMIEAWRDDPDAKVRAFATRYARELDGQIASEQRRADQAKAIRKLDYDEDIDG